eukprot:763764-Hanusia_phi.AAC.5
MLLVKTSRRWKCEGRQLRCVLSRKIACLLTMGEDAGGCGETAHGMVYKQTSQRGRTSQLVLWGPVVRGDATRLRFHPGKNASWYDLKFQAELSIC